MGDVPFERVWDGQSGWIDGIGASWAARTVRAPRWLFRRSECTLDATLFSVDGERVGVGYTFCQAVVFSVLDVRVVRYNVAVVIFCLTRRGALTLVLVSLRFKESTAKYYGTV